MHNLISVVVLSQFSLCLAFQPSNFGFRRSKNNLNIDAFRPLISSQHRLFELATDKRSCTNRKFFFSAKAQKDNSDDIFDNMGDITTKLEKNVRPQSKSSEMDTVVSHGVAFGEKLGEVIDKVFAQATKKIPPSSVPALAIIFFSSDYSEQGYGRILPLLLRSFALYGGKAWRDGITVMGCSVAALEPRPAEPGPGVSLLLLQGKDLQVYPFSVGAEAASWQAPDWSYRAGLKNMLDDPDVTMLIFGHPSGTHDALKALHRAFPLSRKVGGIAGHAADLLPDSAPTNDDDRCVVFRKGSGVLDKHGQLLHGTTLNEAKYSSSDDLFSSSAMFRRAGLVAVAIEGLVVDSPVSLGSVPIGPPLVVSAVEGDGTVITSFEDSSNEPAGRRLLRDAAAANPAQLCVGVSVPTAAAASAVESEGRVEEEDDELSDGDGGGGDAGAAAPRGYAMEAVDVREDGALRLSAQRVAPGDTIRLHLRDDASARAALQQSLARLNAAKAVRLEDGLRVAGGLVLTDARAASRLQPLGGAAGLLGGALGVSDPAFSLGGATLLSVLATLPDEPFADTSCEDLGQGTGASMIMAMYGGDKDSENVNSLEDLFSEGSNTLVGAEGRVLEIPRYQPPPSSSGGRKDRRSRGRRSRDY